jgi:hypothetical protein
MKDNKLPTSVRLPKDLEEIIKKRAEENVRSISNEIVFILKEYLKTEI